MIDLICGLESEKIVSEAQLHRNACGAGAVAASIGAAVAMGAERALLLGHISSAEVSERLWGRESNESVGYAGIVFG